MGWNVDASSCQVRKPPARLSPASRAAAAGSSAWPAYPPGVSHPQRLMMDRRRHRGSTWPRSFTTAIAAVRRIRITYCPNSVPSRNPAEAILTASLLVAGLFKSVFHEGRDRLVCW